MRNFDGPSPLTQLQQETADQFGYGSARLSASRRTLDGALVKAFDLGVEAMGARPRVVPDRPAKYVVSLERDSIQLYDEDDLIQYDTKEEAGEAIRNGVHGEAGTRYVLRVELSVNATYDRAWIAIRND
jgi:hypothetical protein